MRTTQEIVASIDRRLRELDDEIKTLDAARLAFDDHEQRASRRPRARKALEALSAGRVESLLSENGGLSTSELAEKTGGDRDHVLTLLRELETAGRVRRTGQRRGTRWQTITDEDRIRERVAELEATRKRPA